LIHDGRATELWSSESLSAGYTKARLEVDTSAFSRSKGVESYANIGRLKKKIHLRAFFSRSRKASPEPGPSSDNAVSTVPQQEHNLPSHEINTIAPYKPALPTRTVRVNKYGLLPLNNVFKPEVPATTSQKTWPVDIVAIHGLDGDAYDTFTTNDVFWLADFLPRSFPAHGSTRMATPPNWHSRSELGTSKPMQGVYSKT
jgi:hypothetical protein